MPHLNTRNRNEVQTKFQFLGGFLCVYYSIFFLGSQFLVSLHANGTLQAVEWKIIAPLCRQVAELGSIITPDMRVCLSAARIIPVFVKCKHNYPRNSFILLDYLFLPLYAILNS